MNVCGVLYEDKVYKTPWKTEILLFYISHCVHAFSGMYSSNASSLIFPSNFKKARIYIAI